MFGTSERNHSKNAIPPYLSTWARQAVYLAGVNSSWRSPQTPQFDRSLVLNMSQRVISKYNGKCLSVFPAIYHHNYCSVKSASTAGHAGGHDKVGEEEHVVGLIPQGPTVHLDGRWIVIADLDILVRFLAARAVVEDGHDDDVACVCRRWRWSGCARWGNCLRGSRSGRACWENRLCDGGSRRGGVVWRAEDNRQILGLPGHACGQISPSCSRITAGSVDQQPNEQEHAEVGG